MPLLAEARRARRHARQRPGRDQREPFQRDRDRLVYCSALRRLGGVTQVVGPTEGHVFHNRLTHTLKVAQLGRRLAQKLIADQPELAGRVGLDPEVVEAACLAHDLGHPPFGHIAEKELDDQLRARDVRDGFEGNAQSFRIITRLSAHSSHYPGLNLTRATLCATLKYPWFRKHVAKKFRPASKRSRKWSAYRTEREDFEWAREGLEGTARSVEAELMDWADDIAYAVHDLEDFFKAGLVPLDRLARDEGERSHFADSLEEGPERLRPTDSADHRQLLDRLFKAMPMREPYRHRFHQRAAIRSFTSQLIGRYVFAISLREPDSSTGVTVRIDPELRHQVKLLQRLTHHYVIANPALATQQYGKRRIVRELFEDFAQIVAEDEGRWLTVLPHAIQDEALRRKAGGSDAEMLRLVADAISSLSDREATLIHGRLRGSSAGSIHDPLPFR